MSHKHASKHDVIRLRLLPLTFQFQRSLPLQQAARTLQGKQAADGLLRQTGRQTDRQTDMPEQAELCLVGLPARYNELRWVHLRAIHTWPAPSAFRACVCVCVKLNFYAQGFLFLCWPPPCLHPVADKVVCLCSWVLLLCPRFLHLCYRFLFLC